MNQNIWGSHMWFSLHTISFNYPFHPTEDEKKNYEIFFLSLQNVIPCPICKKNYIRHIQEHPIHNFLNSRKSLVYWLIDMHNMVNAEIGKKIMSYENVIKKYHDTVQDAKETSSRNKFAQYFLDAMSSKSNNELLEKFMIKAVGAICRARGARGQLGIGRGGPGHVDEQSRHWAALHPGPRQA